jgi:hypothetical protein
MGHSFLIAHFFIIHEVTVRLVLTNQVRLVEVNTKAAITNTSSAPKPSNSDGSNMDHSSADVNDQRQQMFMSKMQSDDLHLYFNNMPSVNKINSLVKFILYDRIVANKGVMLQARPELPEEHFVFKLTYINKGGTMHRTRSIIFIPCTFTQKKTKCIFPINLVFTLALTEDRHIASIVTLKLMHDIESNLGPAPPKKHMIVSLNCQGLGNIDKSRLLLNKMY